MSFYIAGTGSALPEKIVSNEDLTAFLDTSDEWIFTRTGIHNRRVLTHETLNDLAILSARRALEDAGVTGQEVGLILCATMRGDTVTPSLACVVAEAIGSRAPAFDVNAACVGVLYCMEIADSFIATGKADTVLIVSTGRTVPPACSSATGPARSCSEKARAGWRGCCPPIPIRTSSACPTSRA